MDSENLSSSQTLRESNSPSTLGNKRPLDLSDWPPIYVSATHFDVDDLHTLEDDLIKAGAILTYDINEAEIILSKVERKARIQFDLRSKGLWTRDVSTQASSDARPTSNSEVSSSVIGRKRRRDETCQISKGNTEVIVLDDSSTEIEEGSSQKAQQLASPKVSVQSRKQSALRVTTPPNVAETPFKVVEVVRAAWFHDSQKEGHVAPLEQYLIFTGHVIQKTSTSQSPDGANARQATTRQGLSSTKAVVSERASTLRILERAKEDQEDSPKTQSRFDRFGRRKFGLNVPSADPQSWEAGHGVTQKYAHLLHATTTEQDSDYASDIPEPPEWVKKGIKYACQRPTPKDNPNDAFLSLLKHIKLGRLLTNDEIGVRAYSTFIASIAAYPYAISNPREIMALPGCDAKLANLYVEWANTGRIQAVEDLLADEDMKVLRSFYDIWGVGATTAREFYYDRGWQDLDDIIEFGWKTLSRVQQIGVKFYDEFLDPIPRADVKSIGEIIHQHAVKVRDDGIQSIIVGGYRRGKEACGDVDIVISHPDESQTANLVNDIVASLEEEEWITHTLLLSLHNTHRGQQTLPFRAGGGGHGFDTLDKALVVWQDPSWPTKERDLVADAKAKNPNIHRRVDIIISPWRTVGCAVVGWSGGTTFERDLRRYAKHSRSWKFDSSGVRDRRNGEVVDLEGFFGWKGQEGVAGRAKTMEEAEKRVFEGFGIDYREPWERCTG